VHPYPCNCRTTDEKYLTPDGVACKHAQMVAETKPQIERSYIGFWIVIGIALVLWLCLLGWLIVGIVYTSY
jgi:hypothetical protein